MTAPTVPSGAGGFRAFRDMRVGAKIYLAVVLVIAVAVGVGALAMVRMSDLNGRLETIKQQNVDGLRYVDEARRGIERMYSDLSYYFAPIPNKPSAAQYLPTVQSDDQIVDDAIAAYKGAKRGHNADAVAAFEAATNQYRGLRDTIVFQQPPRAGVNIPTETAQVLKAFRDGQDNMDATLQKLVQAEIADAEGQVSLTRDAYDSSVRLIVVVIVAGLVLAVALAALITRRIVGPLRDVSACLAAVADGDLTHTVPVTSRDELGQMAGSLNRATESVRETVRALRTSAETLSTSSAQLTGLSDRIAVSAEAASSQASGAAGGAEQVSRNMQTVAAGAEEMGASIREISTNASQGAQVAAQAVQVARSTNETIAHLGESSARIGSVIKTITSIAEQTNLLALNATTGVAGNIAGVAGAAQTTAASTGESRRAAADLAGLSDELRTLVGRFKY